MHRPRPPAGEREQRHRSAFAVVIRTHDKDDVFDGNHQVTAQTISETTPKAVASMS